MTEKLNHTEFDRKLVSRTGALQSANVEPAKPNQAIVGKSRWYLPGWGTARRVTLVVICFVLLLTIAIPTIGQLASERRYALNDISTNLLDKTNPNLSAKLTQDPQTRSYYFNKQGLDAAPKNSSASPDAKAGPDPAAALKQMQAQVGGGSDKDAKSLYSVEFPEDSSKGITYYDNNLGVSFKLYSQNSERSPRLVDGRIVYPANQGVKAVYTAKNNGIKEDIIVPEFQGDKLEYSYKLELPKELEARLTDDGGLGVYSADPTFFGNVSYGSPEDETNIRNARLNGEKKHLVFAIPAPTIVQTGSKGQGNAQAYFTLENNQLKVTATQLKDLVYPISVDPSVVITSSTDFQTGNDEGDIDYTTAGEIKRNSVSGGSVGAYTNATGFTNNRSGLQSVAYNGFLYIVGGAQGATNYNDVQYAPINANGSIGAWQYTFNSASSAGFVGGFISGRYDHQSLIYNGYLYVVGGTTNGTANFATIQYAKVNSDGTVGTWNTNATNITSARNGFSMLAYNGTMYVLGGFSTVYLNEVSYAPIRADGTVGAFTVSGTPFATVRQYLSGAVFNNYIYVFGGTTTGGTAIASVQYAPLSADGIPGVWTATTALPVARYVMGLTVSKGYVRIMGGLTTGVTSSTIYAKINANGTLGSWESSTLFSTPRSGLSAVSYNNFQYLTGGNSGATYYNTTQYTAFDPPGVLGSYTTSSSLAANTAEQGTNSGRYYHRSVAYNGYVYVLGGQGLAPVTGEATLAQTQVASLNPDGSLGTWAATTALPSVRHSFGAFANNGFMYVLGGFNGTAAIAEVRQAPINADGTLGAWSAAGASTSLPEGRYFTAATTYAGYAYVTGGLASGFGNDVLYAAINSDGTIGAWTRSANTFTNRYAHTSVISGGYIYVIGGLGAETSIQYALLNSINGSVGVWASAAAMATGRDSHTSEVYNGVLYIFGGRTGATNLNDTIFAPLNANGSVGLFTTTNSYNTASFGQSSAVYKDFLYVIGGRAASFLATSQYASIRHGGPGTANVFAATSSFTTARKRHTTIISNGFIYVIGGFDGNVNLSNIQYAPINNNGTLGAFVNTTSLPTARTDHTSVVDNGFLYVIGGYNGTAHINNVQYAPINSNGTLGAFVNTTSLPAVRSNHTSVVKNGYLYAIGGSSGVNPLNDVIYAPINSTDGSVGAFSTTTSFVTPRRFHTSVVNNNFLYVIGGSTDTIQLNDVQYAPINSNGTLGAFTATTKFTTAREEHASFISNGYIYIVGGVSSIFYNDIQYAPINPNGSVGVWTATTSITTVRSGLSVAAHNGYVYVLGGVTNLLNYLNDVQYASLNSTPKKARYSKLVDLGSVSTLTNLSLTGTLANGNRNVSVKVAGADNIFGTAKAATTLNGSCAAGIANARYVFLTIDMDDSMAGGYADTIGLNSTLQDITLTYEAPNTRVEPSLRLRSGKSFVGQVQQQLDTAKSLIAGC